MAYKILVSDNISKNGISLLEADPAFEVVFKTGMPVDELKKEIEDAECILVRSQTKLTADVLALAKNLKVIGRAGAGLDNVDLPAATERGIVVMNTPGGNTVSTAEHSMAMMLALSRNIAPAAESLRAGRWDRKKYAGVELYGKI